MNICFLWSVWGIAKMNSEFEKWWSEQNLYIQENVNKKALELSFAGGRKDALEWYKKIANDCEKSRKTLKDYKILWLHLKQVLKNELEKLR